jgi:hypothetical protein
VIPAEAKLEQVKASRDKAFDEIAAAWAALAKIPGYPHVRTAPDPVTGAASLAVNIEHLGRDLAELRHRGAS